MLMAAACGRGGRILACEPNPLLAETYVPGNLALNGFQDRVEICQKVIGNINAERVEFVLHHGDYATSSLERWAYAHRCATTRATSTCIGMSSTPRRTSPTRAGISRLSHSLQQEP